MRQFLVELKNSETVRATQSQLSILNTNKVINQFSYLTSSDLRKYKRRYPKIKNIKLLI